MKETKENNPHFPELRSLKGKPQEKMEVGVPAQVVKRLPSKCEALSLNPSTTQTKNQENVLGQVQWLTTLILASQEAENGRNAVPARPQLSEEVRNGDVTPVIQVTWRHKEHCGQRLTWAKS
jgi:hypothetical protein